MANTNYYFSDRCLNITFTGLGTQTPYFVYYKNQEVTPKTQMPGFIPGHTIISDLTGKVQFFFYMNDGNIITDAPVDLTTGAANTSWMNYQGNSVIQLIDTNGNIAASQNISLVGNNSSSVYNAYTNPSIANNGTSFAIIPGTVLNPIVAQTFYVDPNAVANATEVNITSINLYAKQKPSPVATDSGIVNPGVNIVLLPTANGVPCYDPTVNYASAYLNFTEIATSIDASVASNFHFSNPVPVSTGSTYAMVVIPDQNESFTFWTARYGDTLVNSNNVGGPAKFTGNFFELTSSNSQWSPITNTALTFDVYVARYANNGTPVNSNSTLLNLYTRNYEFFLYDEVTSGDVRLAGGEAVFRLSNNTYTGNIVSGNNVLTVTTANVNFTNIFQQAQDLEYIAVKYQNNYFDVRRVVNVLSNTQILVDVPFSITNSAATFWKSPVALANYTKVTIANGGIRRFVSLNYSTSNGSVAFANGDTIVGAFTSSKLVNAQFFNLPVSYVNPEIYINNPTGSSFTATQTFDYTTNDYIDAIVDGVPDVKNITMYNLYGFNYGENVMIPSRTNEMAAIGLTNSHSSTLSNASFINVQITTQNDFVAPQISASGASCFMYYFCINDDYTNENTMYGNAFSRHITTKVNLDANVMAEDLLVYLTAYRPPNTDLKVFAKIYNNSDSDYFDDKDWTLLEERDGPSGAIYSAYQNTSDYIQLTYGFQQYPNTLFTANGLVTCNINSSNVIGSNTTFGTDILVGDIVKIYQPLFPNDYFVASVLNISNSTLLTLDQQIANSGVAGSGLYIDKIGYPLQAFNNVMNDNVVRYYNTNKAYFDTFGSFALKIVFLSPDVFSVPYVKNITGVAVSS